MGKIYLKKIKNNISVFIFLLLLLISKNVIAGDIPEALMQGEQQALFVGEITAIGSDYYSIKPSTIMMGEVQQSELNITKFDQYYGTSDKPKEGNYIVAVLLDDRTIDDTWIFKCDTNDYKSLKLVSERYDMVVRYESYINEGKYFEAQKKIDKDKQAPSLSSTEVISDTTKIKENIKVEPSPKINSSTIFSLIAVCMAFLILIKFKKSH